MEELQARHERTVADRFIEWYNAQHGTNFSFQKQARKKGDPDFEYNNGKLELIVEVTDAYYDDRDAALQWQNARGDPKAHKKWSGMNFDTALVAKINELLTKKCNNDYGSNCVLVINVQPQLTTVDDLGTRLAEIRIPIRNPFTRIYLTGLYPMDRSNAGGYQCWPLFGQVAE